MTEEQANNIVDLAEKFHKSAKQNEFQKMMLQIKMIFRKEEAMYKQHDHPDTWQHIKIHKEFERVMAYFEQTYFNKKEKTISVLNEFCLYVKNWTLLHYECYDKFMMPYIRISEYTKGSQ
jgi:hemerythrin